MEGMDTGKKLYTKETTRLAYSPSLSDHLLISDNKRRQSRLE